MFYLVKFINNKASHKNIFHIIFFAVLFEISHFDYKTEGIGKIKS